MSSDDISVSKSSYISEDEDPFSCFDDDSDSSIDDDDDDDDVDGEDEDENEVLVNNPPSHNSSSTETNNDRNSNTNSTTDDQKPSNMIATSVSKTEGNGTSRDRTCGILSFHTKTESSLLVYVRNIMSQKRSSTATNNRTMETGCSTTTPPPPTTIPTAAATTTTAAASSSSSSSSPMTSCADQVLAAVDEFCQNRHWMMHIGPEKGNDILIKEGLNRALQTYLLDIVIKRMKATPVVVHNGQGNKKEECTNTVEKESFIAVEMGTYCGYSSILLGKYLKKAVADYGIKAHIYSVEVDPHCAQVANEMIQMAELQDIITVVLLGDNQDAKSTDDGDDDEDDDNEANKSMMMPGGSEDMSVKILQECVLPQNCEKIDFLFLDHDKFLYLPSFLAFQRANLLRKGTLVVADNVLFAGIMDYISYVRELQNQGVVQTKTIESRIEYWTERELLEAGEETLRDGVEITTFL